MIKALILDFSGTIIFPKDRAYSDSLNDLYKKLIQNPDFDFLANFELNEELIIFLTNLKEKYKLFLFTDSVLQNAPEIKDRINVLFDQIFSAEELMINKSDHNSYKKLAQKINMDANDILFIDDTLANVEAARFSGMDAILYKDNKSLMNYIETIV